MAKNKKASWPIWVTVVITLGILGILLTDWERYPTAEEVSTYLEDQDRSVERVEVTKMEEFDEESRQLQVYYLTYHHKSGETSEHQHVIRKKDRKAVYPWHDYYRGMYRNDQP